jgi:hypothetical protein
VFPGVDDPAGDHSGYVGVRLDATVNLKESREFAGLDRPARLRTAVADQHRMITDLSGAEATAFDLRLLTDPNSATVHAAILARSWSGDPRIADDAATRAGRQLLASLPGHVIGSALEDPSGWLDPFGPATELDSVVLTRRELIGVPSRPDAGSSYYFSVAGFGRADSDWQAFYAALAGCRHPCLVSIAVFPFTPPPGFGTELARVATYYGRLAREDERRGGLYYGAQRLPADAFAVQAEAAFADYLRRTATRALRFRIQVSAPDRLPPAVVAALAAAISPADAAQGSDEAPTGVEVRPLTGAHGSQVARWNLTAIDTLPAPGRPDLWNRPDRPTGSLPLLSTIGDAAEVGCAFRLPIAVDGVAPGFAVRRGSFGHAEAYLGHGPALTLGTLAGSDQALRLSISALTRHALVAGSTGSGKTTTVLHLLRQLWVDHRVPFLVIEPVNAEGDDYRRLLAAPGMQELRVITVGDDDLAPLRLNPFEVPTGVLVAEHISNLLGCFKAAFGLWEPLPSIYLDALESTYAEAGILSSQRATPGTRWPTVVEFLAAMTAVTRDLGYAGEVKANIEAASLRRARQLAGGVAASVFLTDQSIDPATLLATPVIVELKSLGGGDEQALVIALLLNMLTEHYKSGRAATGDLVHVTVVEEAHRLLGRPSGSASAEQAQAKEKAAQDFANTLAENRKYGEGMVIAEQIPTKLVDDAVKNTNLKVVHRLTAEEERTLLGGAMGLDEAQRQFVARLGAGEAIVYSDAFAEATHVVIPPPRATGTGRVVAAAAPAFAGCGPCRAKCRYRGAALAIVRQRAVREHLTTARRAVAEQNLSPDQAAERWSTLLEALRATVRRYPVLPHDEPNLSDAAFCLFLHSLGIDSMRASPRWPAAVASRLGL